MSNLTDEQLLRYVEKLGKEMTASSSNVAIQKEKERAVYIREVMKRGLGGMKSKAKYWKNF